MAEETQDEGGGSADLRVAREGFRVSWSDPGRENEKVDQLLQAILDARAQTGEAVERIDPQLFATFVRQKTEEYKASLQCEFLSFSVNVEEGRVKLRVAKHSEM
ncbi:MAG: MXAN_5187 C-terminal domain-containing protein [Terriglobia bacterium]